jgi:hypothetical protein
LESQIQQRESIIVDDEKFLDVVAYLLTADEAEKAQATQARGDAA